MMVRIQMMMIPSIKIVLVMMIVTIKNTCNSKCIRSIDNAECLSSFPYQMMRKNKLVNRDKKRIRDNVFTRFYHYHSSSSLVPLPPLFPPFPIVSPIASVFLLWASASLSVCLTGCIWFFFIFISCIHNSLPSCVPPWLCVCFLLELVPLCLSPYLTLFLLDSITVSYIAKVTDVRTKLEGCAVRQPWNLVVDFNEGRFLVV